MRYLFLIFFLLPVMAVATQTERVGIDTTHVDHTAPFDGNPYDVGDTIGGYEVKEVTTISSAAQLPILIGKNATEGGHNQDGWDVYVFSANITYNASGTQDAPFVFTRNDVGSVAPRLVIITGEDFTFTFNHDSVTSIIHEAAFKMTGVGGGPATTGGVSDSIIIKNFANLDHNLNWTTGTGDPGGGHGRTPTILVHDVHYLDLINIDININPAFAADSNNWSVGGLGVRIQSGGSGAMPTDALYGNYSIYLDDVDVHVHSTSFYRRDDVFASGMYLGGTHRIDSMKSSDLFDFVDDSMSFHFTVKNCDIPQTPHFGFFMFGTLDFHNNTVVTRSRNDYWEWFSGGDPKQIATKRAANAYTFPDGTFPASGNWPILDSGIAYGAAGSGMGWSQFYTSDNSYAIALSDGFEGSGRGVGPGSKFYNNTISRGEMFGVEKWQGNRGFTIESPQGHIIHPSSNQTDDSVLIYDNTITLSQGRNGGFSRGTAWGARFRWGGGLIRWSGNTIIYVIDSRDNDGTAEASIPSSAGSKGYGWNANLASEGGSDSMLNVFLANNRVLFEYHIDSTLDGASSGSGTDVLGIGAAYDNGRNGVGAKVSYPVNSTIVQNNYFSVPTVGIQWGGANTNGPMQNTVVFGDTIFRMSTYNVADWKSIQGGYPDGFNDTNNTFLDLVYQNGATEAQRTLAEVSNDYWRWARTMRVVVVGSGAPPFVGVPQCSVTTVNSYTQTIANNVEVGAKATWSDSVYYEVQGGGTFVDSALFNDHTISARKGAVLSGDSVITIDADRNTLILTLAVAGSVDTTGWQGTAAAAVAATVTKIRQAYIKAGKI